jgi:hypothetical protein
MGLSGNSIQEIEEERTDVSRTKPQSDYPKPWETPFGLDNPIEIREADPIEDMDPKADITCDTTDQSRPLPIVGEPVLEPTSSDLHSSSFTYIPNSDIRDSKMTLSIPDPNIRKPEVAMDDLTEEINMLPEAGITEEPNAYEGEALSRRSWGRTYHPSRWLDFEPEETASDESEMGTDEDEVISDEDFSDLPTDFLLSRIPPYDPEPGEGMIFDVNYHYEDPYDSDSGSEIHVDLLPQQLPAELWDMINQLNQHHDPPSDYPLFSTTTPHFLIARLFGVGVHNQLVRISGPLILGAYEHIFLLILADSYARNDTSD